MRRALQLGGVRGVRDQVVVHVVLDRRVVQPGEKSLQPAEQHGAGRGSVRRVIRRRKGTESRRVPAAVPWARGLPVLSQISYRRNTSRSDLRERHLAHVVQRVDQALELGGKLGEYAAEGAAARALRAAVGERAVGSPAHRNVVVDVDQPPRESMREESRDEQR